MPTLERLLSFFKALSDETRLRILGLLADEERSVQELATTLGVKEPTVSHHLSRLKELGLVRMRAEGNVHHYQLDPTALHALAKEVLTPESIATAATEDLDLDRYRRKVLSNFIEDGRLVDLPAQRKKREVVLAWLLQNFEPGRRYPETEVNEILKRFHPDCATIRREFVINKMMRREESVYWREG